MTDPAREDLIGKWFTKTPDSKLFEIYRVGSLVSETRHALR
jgi:hypothetical protein